MIPASGERHDCLPCSGHGDHGGGTVDPSKHIDVSLQGLRPDGTVSLGAPLTYTISLKDGKLDMQHAMT